MSTKRIPTHYEGTGIYNSKKIDALDPAVCCVGSKQSKWLCGDYNNPESQNCQVFMADRCSKGEWDSFCDVYSKDRAGSKSTSKVSIEDLGGEISVRSKFLRNTLANKYCVLTDNNPNCRAISEPFDLSMINGPIITSYEGDCGATCSNFTPEDLDKDVVLEECLRNGMCKDVIASIVNYAGENDISLAGTKLAHLTEERLERMDKRSGNDSATKENYGKLPYTDDTSVVDTVIQMYNAEYFGNLGSSAISMKGILLLILCVVILIKGIAMYNKK